MSTHDVTLWGYALLVGALAVLELVGRRPGSSVPSLGVVIGTVMSRRSGRVAVMAAWVWLGLHFLAL